jgi:hypothetical protein
MPVMPGEWTKVERRKRSEYGWSIARDLLVPSTKIHRYKLLKPRSK